MHVTQITANLPVADLVAAEDFYCGFLGLKTEEFNLGWVVRFSSPENGEHVQLVTQDATAPEDSVISVKVDDVDAAYDEALRRGYDIVHPLTDEEWGIRRFFVRDPDGTVLNIAQH